MAFYRRLKLGFDEVSRYVTSKPLIYNNQLSKFTSVSNHPIRVPKIVNTSSNFRPTGSGYRYYYVDSRQVRHFKPQWFKRWTDNPRNVLIVVLVGSGVGLTVYFGNVETIPYTKRGHLVLMSHSLERMMGESQFQNMEAGFKGKILPVIHPESVRVWMISKDIIEALQRGLKKEQVWTDLSYG